MVAKEDATEEQVARERVVLLEETFAMALGTGSEMNQESSDASKRRVRFSEEPDDVLYVEKAPTLLGTATLYFRNDWSEVGLLGCVIGRSWKDIPTSKVLTIAGDLFVAEVTNKIEADDDTRPFLEFMVTNKRGRFLKPKTGGNYTITHPGIYILDEAGEIRRLQHAIDRENGIVYEEEAQQPPVLPEASCLVTPTRLCRPTSCLAQALKPALKSPSPAKAIGPLKDLSVTITTCPSMELEDLEDQHIAPSKLTTCGTPPKKSMMNRGMHRPPSAIPAITSASTIMV